MIAVYRDCQGGTYYIFNTPPTRRCEYSCVTTMCGEVQIPNEHLRVSIIMHKISQLLCHCVQFTLFRPAVLVLVQAEPVGPLVLMDLE